MRSNANNVMIRSWESCWCTSTLVHPIIGGYPGELNIIIHPCGNLGACPWRYRCGWCVHGRSRCSLLKVGNNLWGLSNSCDAHFGTTCKVRPTHR